MAQYGVIRRIGPGWVFEPPVGPEVSSQDFGKLLNDLARQNWKPVLAGDFLGNGGDELILEK